MTSSYRDDFRAFGHGSRDEVEAGIRAEYHLPLGEKWQLDVSGRAFLPVRKEETGHRVDSFAQIVWIATDRWLVSANVSQERIIRRGESEFVGNREDWTVTYGAEARCYLEDRLFLGLRASERQRAGDTLGFYGEDTRSTQVTLELGYQILDRLFAPAIITPVSAP